MDLLVDEEQSQLADAFARAAREMFPLEEVHEHPSDSQWSALAELGWLGILTPEPQGGTGLSMVETILLFREIGRHLVPGPLLSSVLGARMAALAGDADLAAAIIAGRTRVALLEEADGGSGDKRVCIIDGDGAELGLLLSPAGEARMFALPAAQTRAVSIDPASTLAYADLPEKTALTLPAEAAHLFVEANLLVAAMAAGMCEATCAESAEYAKIREQFGRPIGVFQAVSHRCADMAARADVAWMQVVMAALMLDADDPEAKFAVDVARLTAISNAEASAADNVQNHGGMGFTEELPPHRFVKRAFLFNRLLGGRRAAQTRILDAAASPSTGAG